ncbi:AChain A, fructan 1-exohydrolase Iia [Tanacetum coccineum]
MNKHLSSYLTLCFLVLVYVTEIGEATSRKLKDEISLSTQKNEQPYRTGYHFQPPSNWMNDPNGGPKTIVFRDPSSAWLGPDGVWRFVVGADRDNNGKAFLYQSTDFKKWERYEQPLASADGTGTWECPDFFPVPLNSTNGLDTSAYSGSSCDDVMKRLWDGAGLQSFPRTLWIDRSGKQLIQWPVQEIELPSCGILKEGRGVLDTTSVDPQALCTERGASSKGAFGPFGLLAMASKDLEEQTAIFFRVFQNQMDRYSVSCLCSDNFSRSTVRSNIDTASFGAFVDIDPQYNEISLRQKLVSKYYYYVYSECLKLIPHKKFSFCKYQQLNFSGARAVFGNAIGIAPKDKLGNMDHCRKLYEEYLEWSPENFYAWSKYAELERSLMETKRARPIFELAIAQPALDMP